MACYLSFRHSEGLIFLYDGGLHLCERCRGRQVWMLQLVFMAELAMVKLVSMVKSEWIVKLLSKKKFGVDGDSESLW